MMEEAEEMEENGSNPEEENEVNNVWMNII